MWIYREAMMYAYVVKTSNYTIMNNFAVNHYNISHLQSPNNAKFAFNQAHKHEGTYANEIVH